MIRADHDLGDAMLDDARIFHVNVNCSHLASSRVFYVDTCGLAEGVHTAPSGVQSGVAFGLDRAQWDAWILIGAAAFEGGAVDLLEWQEPAPVGTPPLDGEPGFASLGIAVGADHATGILRDPDGVSVELVAGATPGLAFVAIACADLDRSRAFYDRLGFRAATAGPDAAGRIALEAPGGGPVRLLLGAATQKVPAGPPRPAHTIGIWRTALLVAELDAAVGRLRGAGIAVLSDPQAMAMGPGLPDLRFVCLRGPDDEVLELIEAPTVP